MSLPFFFRIKDLTTLADPMRHAVINLILIARLALITCLVVRVIRLPNPYHIPMIRIVLLMLMICRPHFTMGTCCKVSTAEIAVYVVNLTRFIRLFAFVNDPMLFINSFSRGILIVTIFHCFFQSRQPRLYLMLTFAAEIHFVIIMQSVLIRITEFFPAAYTVSIRNHFLTRLVFDPGAIAFYDLCPHPCMACTLMMIMHPIIQCMRIIMRPKDMFILTCNISAA